jgi:hypothetical protein
MDDDAECLRAAGLGRRAVPDHQCPRQGPASASTTPRHAQPSTTRHLVHRPTTRKARAMIESCSRSPFTAGRGAPTGRVKPACGCAYSVSECGHRAVGKRLPPARWSHSNHWTCAPLGEQPRETSLRLGHRPRIPPPARGSGRRDHVRHEPLQRADRLAVVSELTAVVVLENHRTSAPRARQHFGTAFRRQRHAGRELVRRRQHDTSSVSKLVDHRANTKASTPWAAAEATWSAHRADHCRHPPAPPARCWWQSSSPSPAC